MTTQEGRYNMTPLMTANEVGNYLKVKPRYVTEKYLLIPSFPKPIRLPTPEGGLGHPKWKPEEIENWVEKFRC